MFTDGDGPDPTAVVTAENWQLPPYNRWAYWHVKDIIPTQRIAPARRPRQLPPADGPAAAVDIGQVGLTRLDGRDATVADVLAETYTDALLILQDGAVVTEWYGPEGAPDRTHAVMSITKSVIGCVAGARHFSLRKA